MFKLCDNVAVALKIGPAGPLEGRGLLKFLARNGKTMRRRSFVLGAGVAVAAAGVGLHHRATATWEAPLPPRGTRAKGGGLIYGIADRHLFDYGLYDYEGYWLRGPDPRPSCLRAI